MNGPLAISTDGENGRGEPGDGCRRTRLVFMGTPDFACPSLQALHSLPFLELAAVVTQPDKAVGRRRSLQTPPVKRLAETLGLRVLQPAKMRDGTLLSDLRTLNIDIILTCAYGRILPEEILNLPKLGCYNLHASLLPNYRGASPIQAALRNGDAWSGVTLFKMDAAMDHGPIYAQKRLRVTEDLDYPALSRFLALLSAEVLRESLGDLIAGRLQAREQEHEKASFVHLLRRTDGELRATESAGELHNLVRALTPWPAVSCRYKGKRLKIYKTRRVPSSELASVLPDEARAEASTAESSGLTLWLSRDKKRLFVRAADGDFVEILDLQMDASRRMEARACAHNFHNGEALEPASPLPAEA